MRQVNFLFEWLAVFVSVLFVIAKKIMSVLFAIAKTVFMSAMAQG